MVKVISKKELGVEDVYDICMPEIHNFVAEGIIVHNCDLPQRETLVGKDGKSGFLFERWGNMAAQVSTRQTIRLKSAIKDADRYLNGKVSQATERFTESLPLPPQGVSDQNFIFGYEDGEDHISGILETNEDLQKYIKENPQIWDIVSKSLGITRAYGRHACAFLLSDIPISEMMPTKEGYVTHYEHKECELAGAVKYDFLTISQLLDIEVCLNFINKKNGDNFEPGYFRHNGKKTYIWDLPEESDVYKSIWNGDTVSLFQINSTGMASLTQKILPTRLEDLAAILALERPGPKDYKDPETGLNMVEEYVLRRNGESEPDIKELADILPDSYGTLIYQEDLGKVAKQLAGFSDEDAETLRENMAKKKMVELTKIRPLFMAGATQKVSLEVASKIWEQMVTFGRYGFSCIDGNQKIQTKQGLIRISEIVDNPQLYEVASYSIHDRNLKYETPSNVFKQGFKEVWEVELDDGSIIKATSDHKFLSGSQWITLKDIIEKGLEFDVNKNEMYLWEKQMKQLSKEIKDES